MRRDLVTVAALLAGCTLYSLPTLLNAAGTHSDAAVVGLQAMHLLRGEWSWFLWGSGYQTSVDSCMAAALFRVLGATPTALMLSAFLGYLAMIALVYATLRRHFTSAEAALLVSPLVLIAGPVRTYAFYPPRQASLTLLCTALFVADGTRPGRRASLRLAVGASLAGLACFADPYCLLFLPAVLLFVTLQTREASAGGSFVRAAVPGALGLALGLVPFFLLTHSQKAVHGVYGFAVSVLRHNATLLVKVCLPFLLSARVRIASAAGDGLWHPPFWFRSIQLLGGAVLLSGIVLGGLLALSSRSNSGDRRLGATGALVLPLTLAAFLFSVMVMDRFSARYLVAILVMAPFALAPVLHGIGPRAFAVALAPYLLSVAVGGWLDNGSNVDGYRIRREAGRARDEHALQAHLAAHGVDAGIADYWVAYRLTFLFRERPIIVPFHPELDRYAPYRRFVDAAPKVAYVYDPEWSNESLEEHRALYRLGTDEFEPGFEEAHVGRYDVLLLTHRRSTSPHIASRPVSTTGTPL